MKNPQAYPLSRDHEGWYDRGMTLLDHFAGLAMQGIVSADPNRIGPGLINVPERAFALAMAMLAKRERVMDLMDTETDAGD